MSLRKTLLAMGVAAAAVAPTAALAWSQAYVSNWIEPAFYYGGPKDGGANAKGTDCPDGIQEMNWDKLLVTPYRSPAKVAEVNNAEYPRPGFLSHLAFRGAHKENLYENPTAMPDPKEVEVTGAIAYGMDLDGNPNNGFTGVNGEKGVDNAFYKVGGCINLLRGRLKDGFVQKVANEYMRNGSTTIVMIVSGDKDPMNDDNVTIGVFNSQDRMVKDSASGVVADLSFKLDATGPSSIFKGKITNGVLESTQANLNLKLAYAWRRGGSRSQELFDSKIRFERQPDGSLHGLVGGYRDWFQHFLEVDEGDTVNTGINESLGHMTLPGFYYALRRAADGLPDAQGRMHGISTWYAMDWTPAFVIDPRNGQQMKVAEQIAATVKLRGLQ